MGFTKIVSLLTQIRKIVVKKSTVLLSENLGRSLRKNKIGFSNKLFEYSIHFLKHRAYLVRTCAAVREKLAKYGLPD